MADEQEYSRGSFSGIRGLRYLRSRKGGFKIGPRITVVQGDGADVTLALGGLIDTQWAINRAINPAYTAPLFTAPWQVPAPNQAILFDTIAAAIHATDNSGKLQVVSGMELFWFPPNIHLPSHLLGTTLPYTFPALFPGGGSLGCEVLSMAEDLDRFVYVPAEGDADGPRCEAILNNTDGAAGHTFRRTLVVTYRVVDNVDYSYAQSV